MSNPKANLGISLTGVMFYPYISWLLEQCKNRSIKRLYFIARDGYILKEIADTLISKRNLNIKTFYIYGSRIAWRLSGLDINNKELYKQFIYILKLGNKRMHMYLEISKDELIRSLPKDLKQYWESKNRDKTYNYFLSNKNIIAKALENNKQKRANAIKYLKNNVDYSDDNFAFVDLGWTCFTQNCLASLFSNIYDKTIKCFYYGTTPICYESINLERICFLSVKTQLTAGILELLLRAPHGQTIDYDYNGNPVLEETNKEIFSKWNFDEYLKSIKELAANLNDYSIQYNYVSFATQDITKFYTEYLHYYIDKNTANLLGSVIHNSFGLNTREYAPKIGLFDALKYLFTKSFDTENIEFSKARSHKFICKIIEWRQKYPKLMKQIIDVHISRNKKQAYVRILGITISFRNLIWKNRDSVLC